MSFSLAEGECTRAGVTHAHVTQEAARSAMLRRDRRGGGAGARRHRGVDKRRRAKTTGIQTNRSTRGAATERRASTASLTHSPAFYAAEKKHPAPGYYDNVFASGRSARSWPSPRLVDGRSGRQARARAANAARPAPARTAGDEAGARSRAQDAAGRRVMRSGLTKEEREVVREEMAVRLAKSKVHRAGPCKRVCVSVLKEFGLTRPASLCVQVQQLEQANKRLMHVNLALTRLVARRAPHAAPRRPRTHSRGRADATWGRRRLRSWGNR